MVLVELHGYIERMVWVLRNIVNHIADMLDYINKECMIEKGD